MKSRKARTEDEKSIPGIADEMVRTAVKSLCKDGKLTPQGRRIAKLMDRIMPSEKVDEWGWNLSRKERAAIKRRAAEKRKEENGGVRGRGRLARTAVRRGRRSCASSPRRRRT